VHRTVRCTTRHEQCLFGDRSPSFSSEADRWTFSPLGAPVTVRCTPDSPVRPSDRWLGHVSPVDRATDRWRRAPLAHLTVRCSPDSPVNFSRCALGEFPRAKSLAPGASLGTGHCPVHPRLVHVWLNSCQTSPIQCILIGQDS
jgi:hypothetical protein